MCNAFVVVFAIFGAVGLIGLLSWCFIDQWDGWEKNKITIPAAEEGKTDWYPCDLGPTRKG